MSASTTGASATNGANGGAHNRQHNQGNQERKYTVEQKAAVLRIRKCSPTAFYEILEITKTATDSEIKKAYRKQSLLTHPDKNGHEHADEAFKMVARAFSVLGDKDKRDKFDRFGTDPDNRFSSAGQQPGGGNPFAGFARRAASGGGGPGGGPGFGGAGGGGMWEEEISPEEMFARFFGGGGFNTGGFGGAFDGGPQFFFNFPGGAGVRVHQFGGARPRGRPRNPGQPGQQQEEPSIFNTIIGLLPILLLFIFPILSSLFSDSDSGPKLPTMSIDTPQAPYVMQRVMPQTSTRYFLDPKEVAGWTTHKLSQLDKQAEVQFVTNLSNECERERAKRQQLEDAAQGWFSPDPEKMALAQAHPMPACQRLASMGVRR